MKKINFLTILWILFYLFVFSFLIRNSFSYLDHDLGWHLAVGKEILETKQVPHIEHYNFTLEGERWVDHEWLSNLLLYWGYDNFGYTFINIVFALIILITLIVLNIYTQRYFLPKKNGAILIVLFQVLGLLGMAGHIGVRIQEITVLFTLIVLITIHRYHLNRTHWTLLILPPLFYLWACLHGGFILGIALFISYIGLLIFTQLLKTLYKRDANFKQLQVPTLIFALCVTATFLTPYKTELFSFLNTYRDTYYLTHIQEWLPFYYFPFSYAKLMYAAFVIIAITLTAFSKHTKQTFISSWFLILSSIFLFLSLKSMRHFPLFFVISFPILVEYFSAFLETPNDNILNNKYFRSFALIKPYIIITFLCVIVANALDTNFVTNPFQNFHRTNPVGAVEFLHKHPEYFNKRTLATYDWGGYLIWTLPQNKLFLDGRLPQVYFAGHTIMEEYHEFFAENKAQEKLNQYNVELVLIKTNQGYTKLNWLEKYFFDMSEEEINKDRRYINKFLENSQDWNNIYSDPVSQIYIKK